jgi:hypothetical protein
LDTNPTIAPPPKNIYIYTGLGAAEGSQVEMADLTLQNEKEAVKEIINGIKTGDELDEEKSPPKNPSNGEPDDESEPDSYFAVLYIHESGTERKPLTQDRYNKRGLCNKFFRV